MLCASLASLASLLHNVLYTMFKLYLLHVFTVYTINHTTILFSTVVYPCASTKMTSFATLTELKKSREPIENPFNSELVSIVYVLQMRQPMTNGRSKPLPLDNMWIPNYLLSSIANYFVIYRVDPIEVCAPKSWTKFQAGANTIVYEYQRWGTIKREDLNKRDFLTEVQSQKSANGKENVQGVIVHRRECKNYLPPGNRGSETMVHKYFTQYIEEPVCMKRGHNFTLEDLRSAMEQRLQLYARIKHTPTGSWLRDQDVRSLALVLASPVSASHEFVDWSLDLTDMVHVCTEEAVRVDAVGFMMCLNALNAKSLRMGHTSEYTSLKEFWFKCERAILNYRVRHNVQAESPLWKLVDRDRTQITMKFEHALNPDRDWNLLEYKLSQLYCIPLVLYAIPFETALRFVKDKSCYIEDGYVYVPKSQWDVHDVQQLSLSLNLNWDNAVENAQQYDTMQQDGTVSARDTVRDERLVRMYAPWRSKFKALAQAAGLCADNSVACEPKSLGEVVFNSPACIGLMMDRMCNPNTPRLNDIQRFTLSSHLIAFAVRPTEIFQAWEPKLRIQWTKEKGVHQTITELNTTLKRLKLMPKDRIKKPVNYYCQTIMDGGLCPHYHGTENKNEDPRITENRRAAAAMKCTGKLRTALGIPPPVFGSNAPITHTVPLVTQPVAYTRAIYKQSQERKNKFAQIPTPAIYIKPQGTKRMLEHTPTPVSTVKQEVKQENNPSQIADADVAAYMAAYTTPPHSPVRGYNQIDDDDMNAYMAAYTTPPHSPVRDYNQGDFHDDVMKGDGLNAIEEVLTQEGIINQIDLDTS